MDGARRIGRRHVALAVLALQATDEASATGEDANGATTERPAYSRGLVELKRQRTARETPEETTKGNLKFDHYPESEVVSLLRLELPFPDERTTFWGGDPQLGDAKIRTASTPSTCGSGR